MTIFGVGPLLFVVGLLAFSLVFAAEHFLGFGLTVPEQYFGLSQHVAIFLALLGLWFWAGAVRLVISGHSSDKLITEGVYRYSRNPMYAAFILFFIPAVSLFTGDLLMLLVSAALFLAFKLLIEKEERFLLNKFGTEFEDYAGRVSQLVPFIRL